MVRATRMLSPFPQYTAPDGKLNLMNRLPPQYKQPELPSEVHMVRLSTDPNTKRRGRDNLRYDIADTFDLLVYASELLSEVETAQPAASKRRGRQAKAKPAVVDETPEPPKRHGRSANDQPTKSAGPSPAVVWDIYPFHLQEQLCSFLSNSDDSPPDTDQIITPRTFMGDKQCAEFYEDYEDAQAIRVFQNAGDLVMVPSGFTYQRQTARDTISVRSKFLSPEHASYARNVSEDVTKRGNARRHEALPVMDILWWAWLGCSDRGEASASEFISKSRKHHIAKGVAAAVQKSPAKRARTGSKKQTS
ncbi:Lysine-specific demethylase 3B [Linderina pennispora]|nr:Lysine-specific demethylase 3B [Linderina pennispora]